jgi:hypothetical protein
MGLCSIYRWGGPLITGASSLWVVGGGQFQFPSTTHQAHVCILFHVHVQLCVVYQYIILYTWNQFEWRPTNYRDILTWGMPILGIWFPKASVSEWVSEALSVLCGFHWNLVIRSGKPQSSLPHICQRVGIMQLWSTHHLLHSWGTAHCQDCTAHTHTHTHTHYAY